MDVLQRIRAEIENFPGCESENECRLSDEQVRAYVGERLAAWNDNDFSDGDRKLYERIMYRCEFMNQEAFRVFDENRDDKRIAAVLEADAELIDLAKTITNDSQNAGELLKKIDAALDKRDAAMMQS